MKSIKSKIVVVILAFVVLLSVLFGTIGSYLNYKTAYGVLRESIRETAECAAAEVESEIKAVQSIAFETGSIARLANAETPIEEKKLIINQRVKTHNFDSGNILDSSGKSIFDGTNLSDKDYVKTALGGEECISNITMDKDTGKLTLLSVAPLWENGIPDTKVVGVVYYALPEDFLIRVVKEIKIGKRGITYIINKDGLNVADVLEELVGVENSIEEAKTNPKLEKIAAIESKMIKGEQGVEKCEFDGENKLLGYAPIKNSQGLSVGIMVAEKEFLGSFYESIYITIALTAVTVVIGVFVAIRFGNNIGNPIKKCADRLVLLSKGDLNSDVPTITAKDETAILASATEVLKENLGNVVGEVSAHLTQMANGNFDLENLREYALDFKPLSISTNKIVDSLNEALSQINMSSEQVSSGSDQVSSGAQALSQGATEQAASIEELSATLSNIHENVKRNANNAVEANKISVSSKDVLTAGNEEMKKMLLAMKNIGESSNKIGNIIKTIDDIAFQTNILALNAAVEAARAGSAGKGFAVVADEVRNLASKSAEAAKDTTVLIEEAISAVEKGKAYADSTAKTLISVMEQSQKSADLVNEIAEASGEQANAISQINEGVEQISSVVHTNSATAEESEAASEELNGQAQMLKDLVSKFNLKNANTSVIKTERFVSEGSAKEFDYSYGIADKY